MNYVMRSLVGFGAATIAAPTITAAVAIPHPKS